MRARRRDSLLTTTTTGREGAARGIRVTRDDDETTRAKNREGSLATARVPVARENTDASIPNERWTDGDARAFIISSSSSDDDSSDDVESGGWSRKEDASEQKGGASSR